MKANEYVIVIGRQFGSGGRELGKLLSSRLGIPYYDRLLLKEAAAEFGMREEAFVLNDEKRPSLFDSLSSGFSASMMGGYAHSSMRNDRMFDAQSAVIRRICQAGPCVIVGRTADYICRDLPNIVSIFLAAPLTHRISRIERRGDCPPNADLEKYARKCDRLRENYYNYYTGRRWGHAETYDLCLDSSKLSIEDLATTIIEWLDRKIEQ